jgi:putative transposase
MVQSIPAYSVTKVIAMIRSLTAREVFRRCPQVKKQLWGGEFWTDGYFASTVGRHGNENMIGNYVKSHEKQYQKWHEDHQIGLFQHPVRLRRGSLFSGDLELRRLFAAYAQP